MSTNVDYFDYAATTPLDPIVFEAMMPYFSESFGNPSSIHRAGQRADAAVEASRRSVATQLNAKLDEIVFTSGATESNNLALRGIAFQRKENRGATTIYTTAVEHPSVHQTCTYLASQFGFSLEYLPIDSTGRIQVDLLPDVLHDDTALVSVVYANNEIGTVNPVAEIGSLCRARGIPFHTDAAQAANHLLLDVDQLNVDFMTLGAHKFYGPKGVGVLFHRHNHPFIASQTGGNQEYGNRAGTHNVPSIVGFGKALELARSLRNELTPRLESWRNEIIHGIEATIPASRLTGHRHQRLANHASFSFKGVDSNQLLAALDLAGYACSSGAACKTGNPEPSPILLALGLEPDWALGALRITLGRGTTKSMVDKFIGEFPEIMQRLRAQHHEST
jgi:cysteine desulfurase